MQPPNSPPSSAPLMTRLTEIRARHGRLLALLAGLLFLAYLPPLVNVVLGGWPFHDDAPGLLGPWREFAGSALRRERVSVLEPA